MLYKQIKKFTVYKEIRINSPLFIGFETKAWVVTSIISKLFAWALKTLALSFFISYFSTDSIKISTCMYKYGKKNYKSKQNLDKNTVNLWRGWSKAQRAC